MGHILERCSTVVLKKLKVCSIIALTNHLNISVNTLNILKCSRIIQKHL